MFSVKSLSGGEIPVDNINLLQYFSKATLRKDEVFVTCIRSGLSFHPENVQSRKLVFRSRFPFMGMIDH